MRPAASGYGSASRAPPSWVPPCVLPARGMWTPRRLPDLQAGGPLPVSSQGLPTRAPLRVCLSPYDATAGMGDRPPACRPGSPGRSGSTGGKVSLLLGTQFVTQPARRRFDVIAGQNVIFGNIALQQASLRQPDRQEILGARDVGVFALAVGHVPPQSIQDLPLLEIHFRRRHDLHARSPQGSDGGIVEQNGPRDRRGHLEMAEMVGCVEAIEWPATQFVQIGRAAGRERGEISGGAGLF